MFCGNRSARRPPLPHHQDGSCTLACKPHPAEHALRATYTPRKSLCVHCSAQVALCKLPCQLLRGLLKEPCSRYTQSCVFGAGAERTLRALPLHYKAAMFDLSPQSLPDKGGSNPRAADPENTFAATRQLQRLIRESNSVCAHATVEFTRSKAFGPLVNHKFLCSPSELSGQVL